MHHTTTATLDQQARNTMSLMAWGMALLCAWIMLLSVQVLGEEARADSRATYSTTSPR